MKQANNKWSLSMRSLMLVLLYGLINACALASNPEDITSQFWQAAVSGDEAVMQSLCVIEKEKQIDTALFESIETFSLGESSIEENIARVETRINLKGSKDPVIVMTYLNRIDNDWKVDYKKTISPFEISQDMRQLLGGIEALTEEFAEDLAESVEEFKNKAVPEIQSKLEEAEKELKKNLPEIKQKIDEFLEHLEESIKQSVPPEEPTTTQT